MSTPMELSSILSLLASFFAVLTVFFGFYLQKTRFERASEALKASFAEEMDRSSKLLVDLRSMQARAAGTIRTAERRIHNLGGPAHVDQDGDAAEGGGISPMLAGIARGAGIDLDALAAGDAEQLAKLQSLLPQGRQPQQQHSAGVMF